MWSNDGIIVINVDKINFTIDIIRKIKVNLLFALLRPHLQKVEDKFKKFLNQEKENQKNLDKNIEKINEIEEEIFLFIKKLCDQASEGNNNNNKEYSF